MSHVTPFPLTRARATEIVREIAKDSSRWSINVPYRDTQKWRGLVNRRQVEWCLLDGYVLQERAELDEHGNWRFNIARVCAGMNVVIEVALQNGPALPRLFVTGIQGDEIV
jgi:hypothetical protein